MSFSARNYVTPIVLTYNEEPNIDRALESLRWAETVVVLDSGSTDRTEEIVRSYPNARWFTRPFDYFRNQWEHAINQTGITTEYVLALDADMETTADLLGEVEEQFLPGKFQGGSIGFEYRYFSHALKGSLLPPQLRIFERAGVAVNQPHHGHSFAVTGEVYRFRHRLIHDDRKELQRWMNSQVSYAQLNAKSLENGGGKRWRDRLRRWGIMPPVMGALAYVRAGGPFRGAAAIRYAYERMVAEALLAITVMDKRIKNGEGESSQKSSEANIGKERGQAHLPDSK